MEKISKWDIENDLAKLLLYTKLCILDSNLTSIKDNFIELLDIIEQWIRYYSEDGTLKRVTDAEIHKAHELYTSVPTSLSYEICYYEIETYLDTISYYSQCTKDMDCNSSREERKKDMKL